MRQFNRSILFNIAILFTLTACGGGSGDDSGDDVLTGHFTDSAVAGLSYSTATQSGVTDASGAFTYISGETITFSLGGTTIGEAASAKSEMTPFDLVPGATLYTTTTQVQQAIGDNSSTAARTAFHKLTNILVFLQSLDDDANPDNGINIPEGIAALLDGKQINFDQNLFEFSSGLNTPGFLNSPDTALKNLMHKAASMSLLSTAAIRKPGYALDHFYSAQGISHNFEAPSSVSTTYADSTPDSIETFAYDDNGNVLIFSDDFDSSDGILEVTTRTYDDNGNLLTSSKNNGLPLPEASITRSYDDNGNLLIATEDLNFDAVLDTSTNTYDDTNGNLLTVTKDLGADGSVENVITNTYDDNGNWLTSTGDYNFDAIPDIRTSTYDTNDNRLTFSEDFSADGSVDRITTFTYDDNGKPLTESQDDDADGNADSIFTYTYDTNGNVLTSSLDFGADGIVEVLRTNTFDTNNNQLTEIYTSDVSTDLTTITYNANGDLLTFSIDLAADGGTPESSTSYTYDSNSGNLLTVSHSTNGITVRTETFTFNDNGNLLSASKDTDANGTPDEITTFTMVDAKWTAVFSSLD